MNEAKLVMILPPSSAPQVRNVSSQASLITHISFQESTQEVSFLISFDRYFLPPNNNHVLISCSSRLSCQFLYNSTFKATHWLAYLKNTYFASKLKPFIEPSSSLSGTVQEVERGAKGPTSCTARERVQLDGLASL